MAFDFNKYKNPTQPVTTQPQGSFDFSKYKENTVNIPRQSTPSLTPKQAPSFTDWMMEQATAPLKQAGEGIMNFAGGTMDVLGKTAQGDIGGALQGVGRTLGGFGQIATSPLAPAINAGRNLPQFVQDTIQTAKPSFEKTLAGAGQVGRGFQQGNVKDVVYGGAKALSGGIGTAFSPVGGMMAQLPREIQQGAGVVGQGFSALRGAVPALTGQTGTETGEFMGDVFDIGMTVLPFAGKGIAKVIGKTKTGQAIKEGANMFKQDIAQGYAKNIQPNLQAIKQQITQPLGKVSKPVQTFLSKPADLVTGLKKGTVDVSQVAKKLELPTGEIRNLQKYSGNKDFVKQVNIAEQNLGKRSIGAPTPLRVPAKDILNAGKFIEGKSRFLEAKKARALEEVATKKLNIQDVKDEFATVLKDKGVGITGIKNNKLVFSKTSPFSANAAAQKLLNDTLGMITRRKGVQTVEEVNKIRKALFDRLDEISPEKVGSSSAKIAAGEVLDKVRKSLANKIDSVSPNYKAINMKEAKAIEALDSLKSVLQIKDRFTKLSDKGLKMEEVTGRVLGKAADRPLAAIEKVYDLAVDLGFKGNKKDLFKKIEFADMLENLTGTTKKAGLQGTIEKGIEQTITQGPRSTITSAIARGVTRTPDITAKLKALKQLLQP